MILVFISQRCWSYNIIQTFVFSDYVIMLYLAFKVQLTVIIDINGFFQ